MWWLISFNVKLAATAYILHKFWNYFITRKGHGIWDFLNPKPGGPATPVPKPAATEEPASAASGVVGASRTEYLEPLPEPEPERKEQGAEPVPPQEAEPEPQMSVPMEQTAPPQTDPEFDPDEFNVGSGRGTPPEGIDAQAEFYSFDTGNFEESDGFSSGASFEALGNAAVVLVNIGKGVAVAPEDKVNAAVTLHAMRGTDMMDLFTVQVSNIETVDRLLNECVDGDGRPLPAAAGRKPTPAQEEFDIDKYV